MPPPSHMTAASHNPVPLVSSHNNIPGAVLRDDLSQARNTVPVQPHTSHESPHDLKGLFSHQGSVPALGNFLICSQVSWCFKSCN